MKSIRCQYQYFPNNFVFTSLCSRLCLSLLLNCILTLLHAEAFSTFFMLFVCLFVCHLGRVDRTIWKTLHLSLIESMPCFIRQYLNYKISYIIIISKELFLAVLKHISQKYCNDITISVTYFRIMPCLPQPFSATGTEAVKCQIKACLLSEPTLIQQSFNLNQVKCELSTLLPGQTASQVLQI